MSDPFMDDLDDMLDEESHHIAVEGHLAQLFGMPEGVTLSITIEADEIPDGVQPWLEMHAQVHDMRLFLNTYVTIEAMVSRVIASSLSVSPEEEDRRAADVLMTKVDEYSVGAAKMYEEMLAKLMEMGDQDPNN
jgi:hypothetical protein